MDVTSEHIDVVRKQEWDGEYYEDGEEVGKRVENFGEPAGRRAAHLIVHLLGADMPQARPEVSPFSFVSSVKANP